MNKRKLTPRKLKIRYLLMMLVLVTLMPSFSNWKNINFFQQELVIRGKVTTDICGIPIPGVYVGIKGQRTGVVTDSSGNYRIALNNLSDTLEFIYTEVKLVGNNMVEIWKSRRHYMPHNHSTIQRCSSRSLQL